MEKLTNIIETNNDLKKFLKVWLDYLIELWHNEVLILKIIIPFILIKLIFKIQWCKQVFNDPYSIVMNLLNECFIEFNKKLIVALDVIVEKEALCLDILVDLKEVLKKIKGNVHSNNNHENVI